jgi:hypothetical protein
MRYNPMAHESIFIFLNNMKYLFLLTLLFAGCQKKEEVWYCKSDSGATWTVGDATYRVGSMSFSRDSVLGSVRWNPKDTVR